jgi:hemerythrin superfamily protein
MDFIIPQSMQKEHAELHTDLAGATQVPGKIGEAAQAVAKTLHEHFEREEEFALPPLGLLPRLATDEVRPEMSGVLALTDGLKAELPQMLAEHKAIVLALKNLIAVAEEEDAPELAHFAEKLMLHAQNEEEVAYPTAILVGEYLKLRLGDNARLRT